MTDKTHTQGPWARDITQIPKDMFQGRLCEGAFNKDGKAIALILNDKDIDLIVSAPEMLEALEICAEDLKSAGHEQWRAYKAATSAIAKARGEA